MKLCTLLAFAAAVVLCSVGHTVKADEMSSQDFANKAASSDMFEIQSSELALQKSQNADVKEFAEMMVQDHRRATEGLKAAAEQDGVTVPADLDAKHAEQLQTLEDASAEEFDSVYVNAQVAGHEEALVLMTDYADAGVGSLKSHAESAKPIIQKHLAHIQEIAKSM